MSFIWLNWLFWCVKSYFDSRGIVKMAIVFWRNFWSFCSVGKHYFAIFPVCAWGYSVVSVFVLLAVLFFSYFNGWHCQYWLFLVNLFLHLSFTVYSACLLKEHTSQPTNTLLQFNVINVDWLLVLFFLCTGTDFGRRARSTHGAGHSALWTRNSTRTLHYSHRGWWADYGTTRKCSVICEWPPCHWEDSLTSRRQDTLGKSSLLQSQLSQISR